MTFSCGDTRDDICFIYTAMDHLIHDGFHVSISSLSFTSFSVPFSLALGRSYHSHCSQRRPSAPSLPLCLLQLQSLSFPIGRCTPLSLKLILQLTSLTCLHVHSFSPGYAHGSSKQQETRAGRCIASLHQLLLGLPQLTSLSLSSLKNVTAAAATRHFPLPLLQPNSALSHITAAIGTLTRLTSLSLFDADVAVDSLHSWRALSRLVHWRMRDVRYVWPAELTEEIVEGQFAFASSLTSLQQVTMKQPYDRRWFYVPGLAASLRHGRELRSLTLCVFGVEDTQALHGLDSLTSLELHLDHLRVHDRDTGGFLPVSSLTSLRSLTLQRDEAGRPSVRQALSALGPSAAQLTKVTLRGSVLVEALAFLSGFSSLTSLVLLNCEMFRPQPLLGMTSLKHLCVVLKSTPSQTFMQQLVQVTHLEQLELRCTSNSGLGENVLRWLKMLPKLRNLWLGSRDVKDANVLNLPVVL